jgi:hypothetical protein
MIRADDPLVSQNALVALDEIKASEGGLPMTTKLTMYLLNRLKDYNEWGRPLSSGSSTSTTRKAKSSCSI